MEPHLRQYELAFGTKPPVESKVSLVFPTGSPEYEVQETELEFSTVSCPERRELINSLAFLSLFAQPKTHVLFHHSRQESLWILPELFPEATWEFRGETKLDPRILRNERIWKSREPVSVDYRLPRIAQSDHLLLISHGSDSAEAYQRVKPNEALLFFDGNQKLDGQLLLPVWGEQRGLSAYLVPNGSSKQWDQQDFQNQMFGFNLDQRVHFYSHDVVALGLDHCHCCSSEVACWEMYFLSRGILPTNSLISEKIEWTTRILSRYKRKAI